MKYTLLFIFSSRSIKVPADTYAVSDSFAKTAIASLSNGNFSMRTGRIFTREDHDALYRSIKDFSFTSQDGISAKQ